MTILVAIFTLIFNIIQILVAAWIGVANVPLVLNGTADFWTYVWLGLAVVLLVNAGSPLPSRKD